MRVYSVRNSSDAECIFCNSLFQLSSLPTSLDHQLTHTDTHHPLALDVITIAKLLQLKSLRILFLHICNCCTRILNFGHFNYSCSLPKSFTYIIQNYFAYISLAKLVRTRDRPLGKFASANSAGVS